MNSHFTGVYNTADISRFATKVNTPKIIYLHGIRLIDNINLNELIKENVSEFMFTLSPLKIRGATASPVSPLAIF